MWFQCCAGTPLPVYNPLSQRLRSCKRGLRVGVAFIIRAIKISFMPAINRRLYRQQLLSGRPCNGG